MIENSYQETVNSFNPTDKGERETLSRHITVWVTEETKTKYDLIQSSCSHRFTDTLRKVMGQAINDVFSKLPKEFRNQAD